ncbi:MAG: GRP family sugar transporter [Bacteroidales bacterium]|nr:GRP family sugar transporter [Bacteroidales bacterium]
MQNIQIDWFFYTIIFTIIYGGVNFMYKIAAHHNCSSHKIIKISAITISILSLIIIIITASPFTNFKMLFFFALINSFFFGMGSIIKIQSLKYIPTSFAFPITKLNAVLLIIYALILFNDRPTVLQWAGIGTSIFVLAYISFNIKTENKKTKIKDKKQLTGILFALLAAFATSISMLTGKYASTEVSKINFIFISYTMVIVYTVIINKFVIKKDQKKKNSGSKKVILFGIIIGLLNFAGYYLVLSAFATGPLSLIQGISSNSFIIPIVLSVIFLKEKFTYKNAIVVALSILSIILIKIDF